MNTFPGWRAVGRAMQYTRRQPGINISVTKGGHRDSAHTLNRWLLGDNSVVAEHIDGLAFGVTLTVDTEGGHIAVVLFDGVGPALRLLAALDLIPAEIAEMRDERYGRCETCGEQTIWDDGEGAFDGRWAHREPIAVWREHGPHRAEVAE